MKAIITSNLLLLLCSGCNTMYDHQDLGYVQSIVCLKPDFPPTYKITTQRYEVTIYTTDPKYFGIGDHIGIIANTRGVGHRLERLDYVEERNDNVCTEPKLLKPELEEHDAVDPNHRTVLLCGPDDKQ